MPAGSESTCPPALPRTFRPLGVRIAVYAFATVLLGTVLAIWVAFPPEVRAQFTFFQRATVVFFGLAAAACGYALARSRVVARLDSVTVVNGYKTRRFEWNEIVAIALPTGSPWATIDLSDGTSVAVMGIQGSDGARATADVRSIRSLLRQQSRTDRDD